MIRQVAALCCCSLLLACAGGAPQLPYPAFVESDALEDMFLADLPGVRAKHLAGDLMTRLTSKRIDLPAAWRGTSGGAAGHDMEIFVLAGSLTLGDIEMRTGGYAYLPADSLGFNMATQNGARILYFVSEADADAVIQTPLIINADQLDWQTAGTPGLATRELRADPGSGARIWLLRIDPGAAIPWEISSTEREGYLVAGEYRHSECVDGRAVTDTYRPGGYFRRPAGVINGGPPSGAQSRTMWLLRENQAATHGVVADCAPAN
jgi:quercetin dioxygenase-like cupin family protein